MSCPRNRHNVITLGEHPGQRQLCGRAIVLLRDLLYLRHELEILFEILRLEARVASPEIVLGEIFNALDLAGQKSSTERAVGHEANVEETERIQQSLRGVAGPE